MPNMTFSRPPVSSPLADSSFPNVPPAQRAVVPKINRPFSSSRALRPFPSIAHLKPTSTTSSSTTRQSTVKLIEPPKNFKTSFVLDLTQAEFSRQE